jgi:phosphoribosylamine--glycine ligase
VTVDTGVVHGPILHTAPESKRGLEYDRRVRVLVVGSGGREHALVWSLSRSAGLDEVHAAPGNPGIAALAHCHPVLGDDHAALVSLARELRIDLVVVGPEAPLVAGLADELRHRGIAVFGPSAAAARIEGSKAFAKNVLEAAGVPTARTLPVARTPCVVKVDGLAAGKGVWVCRTQDELDTGLLAAETLGQPFHVEELLEGPELSVFAVAAGESAVPFAPARDYKRIGDGDTGPNTGGMGSFSPLPDVPDEEAAEILQTVHLPVLEELARRGSPFQGLLYAGLMRTEDGLRVIEFNCRFGDPETQSLLPRLESDLLPLLAGDLSRPPEIAQRAAVTVVLSGAAYPERGDRGTPIDGIEAAEAGGALVFHAGTALHDGRLVTNGGRILDVVGVGSTLEEARSAAYEAASHIDFAGMHLRTDIAADA